LFVTARSHVFKEATVKGTVNLWVDLSSLEEDHRRRVEKMFKMDDGKHISILLHGFR
jgi:hypothetical protein